MLTYDDAKKMVLEDCKSATGVDHIVSSAWELPDSFVFGLSPVHLTAYTPEGRARIRSLSTKNARRIV